MKHDFIRTLESLLALDGRTQPMTPDRSMALSLVSQSPWLRFALGVEPGEKMPADDDEGLEEAARVFMQKWRTWTGYRDSVVEISPPGSAPIRFRICEGRGAEPTTFPAATLAFMTAWNPGGDARPAPSANRRANDRLGKHLAARLVERWPAIAAPGTPFMEEGFAVLGLSRDEAFTIAEGFGQLAIYYIDRGQPLLVARRRKRIVAWHGVLRVV